MYLCIYIYIIYIWYWPRKWAPANQNNELVVVFVQALRLVSSHFFIDFPY